MKVVLTQDVKGLGKKGEMVSASDGYCRNYLLPRKLAVEANSQAISELKNRESSQKHKIETEIAEAKEIAKKLKVSMTTFNYRLNELGLYEIYCGKGIQS